MKILNCKITIFLWNTKTKKSCNRAIASKFQNDFRQRKARRKYGVVWRNKSAIQNYFTKYLSI